MKKITFFLILGLSCSAIAEGKPSKSSTKKEIIKKTTKSKIQIKKEVIKKAPEVQKDPKETAPNPAAQSDVIADPTTAAPVAVPAEQKHPPQQASILPRFVTLRAKKVNIHVGPGANFPVSWTLLRQNMPVEVIAEFDTWRQIRDYKGTEGWVHKSLLKGKRFFISMHKTHALKASPDANAKVIAFVESDVVGRVSECQAQWCKVEIQEQEDESTSQNGKISYKRSFKGWLPRKALWGIYPHESKL